MTSDAGAHDAGAEHGYFLYSMLHEIRWIFMTLQLSPR
jgi:hypothetical protein